MGIEILTFGEITTEKYKFCRRKTLKIFRYVFRYVDF